MQAKVTSFAITSLPMLALVLGNPIQNGTHLKDNCATLAGTWTGDYTYSISGTACGFCHVSGAQLIFEDIDGTGSLFFAHRPANTNCHCDSSSCSCKVNAHDYTASCSDSHVTMDSYFGLVGTDKILLRDNGNNEYNLNK